MGVLYNAHGCPRTNDNYNNINAMILYDYNFELKFTLHLELINF